MKSRRNFITKTGMAAAALLVFRPFKNFASGTLAHKLGFGNNRNKLVLLHTGNNPKHTSYAQKKIASLANNNHDILLLKHDETVFSENNYEIVYKNNIRTAIIKADKNSKADAVNRLSSFLKKDKNCQLIICVSSLGYKNKSGLDDLTLAEKSHHIDIIIGNHASNHSPYPIVIRNRKKEEVIIHSATNNGFGLGNIEIGFDEKMNTKKSLAFNNLLTRLQQTA